MNESGGVRKLWLVWWLLPFPLANALILPSAILYACYRIIPAFFGLHFTPATVRAFPSPVQIQAYGLEFYRSLLSQSMLALLLSLALWAANVFLLTRPLKSPKDTAFLKCSFALTASSIISGGVVVVAVGMIG